MNLIELAERCEAAPEYWGDPELDIEVLAAFGLEQRLYPRAGYKLIYPDSGRCGSAIWPTRRLEDVFSVLFWARIPKPEMIATDPRKAIATCLRARASLENQHG